MVEKDFGFLAALGMTRWAVGMTGWDVGMMGDYPRSARRGAKGGVGGRDDGGLSAKGAKGGVGGRNDSWAVGMIGRAVGMTGWGVLYRRGNHEGCPYGMLGGMCDTPYGGATTGGAPTVCWVGEASGPL